MADIQSRLKVASAFILQSPPGEVNDVFNDVRALVGDDDALESGILPALGQYNTEQYIVADLPDKQQLLICPDSRVPTHSDRFIEPKTNTSWSFDHLRLTASKPIEVQVDDACEIYRKELESVCESYAREHYTEGVAKVFTSEQVHLKPQKEEMRQSEVAVEETEVGQSVASNTETAGEPTMDSTDPISDAPAETLAPIEAIVDSEMNSAVTPVPQEAEEVTMEMEASTVPTEPEVDSKPQAAEEASEPAPVAAAAAPQAAEPVAKKFAVYFVGNKYNPSNYWTGRWRSFYSLDLTSSSPIISGSIALHVHFFEQGNVQLTTSYTPTIELPSSVTSSSSATDLAKAFIRAVGKAEEEYQLELNEAYKEMNEKTFRSLRRALPITRQKMDWNKVVLYKVGKDLGNGGQQ